MTIGKCQWHKCSEPATGTRTDKGGTAFALCQPHNNIGAHFGYWREEEAVTASAAQKIRIRYAELEDIRESYLRYQRWRVAEHDHHGAWDVAINLSETECEMAGLKFALQAIAEETASCDHGYIPREGETTADCYRCKADRQRDRSPNE